MYVMTETAFLQVVNASKGGRTAPATRCTRPLTTDAVGESVPAVEESVHGGLFLRPAAPQKRRCYVKKFTYDVIFFTYDVIFFT